MKKFCSCISGWIVHLGQLPTKLVILLLEALADGLEGSKLALILLHPACMCAHVYVCAFVYACV